MLTHSASFYVLYRADVKGILGKASSEVVSARNLRLRERVRVRERERERESQRERERDRQTDRQAGRHTGRLKYCSRK